MLRSLARSLTSVNSTLFRMEFKSSFFFWTMAVWREFNALSFTVFSVSDSNSLALSFCLRIYLMSDSCSLFWGTLEALSIIKSAFFSMSNIFLMLSLSTPTLFSLFFSYFRYLKSCPTFGDSLLSTRDYSPFKFIRLQLAWSISQEFTQSLTKLRRDFTFFGSICKNYFFTFFLNLV